MKIEVSPQDTPRANAYSMWMKSPMPMVTITKTFDISRAVRASKKTGIKLNALLCHCIGMVATQVQEFYLLPEQGKLYQYDKIAINVIVNNDRGGINSCDIPVMENLYEFSEAYNTLTRQTSKANESAYLEGFMVIGTSAVVGTELDCIVNQYTDQFCNPMLMWGKYRKHWFKTTLPISFQFHHVQMDGGHAARFLEVLQQEICRL